MRPCSILRTKQGRAGPRAACSRAGTGRTARARRATRATSGRDGRCLFLPLEHPVARDPAAREARGSGRPALRSSSPRNARLSAMLSQTCGRKVARRPSASTIKPSSPADLRQQVGLIGEAIGFGAERSDTSTRHCGHSAALTAGKRGSRNAAPSAFCATSSPSAPLLEAADAAAQLAVLGQGDERGAGLGQPRGFRFLVPSSFQLASMAPRAMESNTLPASASDTSPPS